MTDWLKLAREAHSQSTTYLDNNFRQQWEDNIRAFQNKHPLDSKYNSDAYAYRSKLFRPKTRTVIRKNEAAGAAAFFSNIDVINVEPGNEDNPMQVAAADIMKQLLQYRLTKTIPWFLTLQGALQDAQVVGVVCSYQYWEYKTRKVLKRATEAPTQTSNDARVSQELPDGPQVPPGDNIMNQKMGGSFTLSGQGLNPGKVEKEIISDKPCVDLIPCENIRIDPAADWRDPVNTSPYLIHEVPMYAFEVKNQMEVMDEKTGQPKWKQLSDAEILSGMTHKYDSTRQAREEQREDSKGVSRALGDFEIVWVHRNFIKHGDEDYVFYTLGTEFLLSDPVPTSSVYFHAKHQRPYVMGYSILETHKVMPDGVAQLGRDIQAASNDMLNSRLDNVKLVLNKRYLVKRGRQVDYQSLLRNVAGSITLVNDVESDVKSLDFEDVTNSSYQEQDRFDTDYNDLTGNFNAAQIPMNRKGGETVKGMSMLSQNANMMTEYLLRTFVETWVEPVLRQLVSMEQEYETDDVVLALVAEKAKIFQRFGLDKVSDDLLAKDLSITVNVGMGATDPNVRVQKLLMALSVMGGLMKTPIPGMKMQEIGKEVFGFIGYRDGKRFMDDGDPMVQKLMATVKQLQMQLKSRQAPQDRALEIAHLKAQTELGKAAMQHDQKSKDFALKAHRQFHDQAHEQVMDNSEAAQGQDNPEAAQGQQAPQYQDGVSGIMSGLQGVAQMHQSVQELNQRLQQQTVQSLAPYFQRITEIMQDMSSKLDTNEGETSRLADETQQLEQAVEELSNAIHAPKSIERDQDGRPVSINGRAIQRDGKGNITGLE